MCVLQQKEKWGIYTTYGFLGTNYKFCFGVLELKNQGNAEVFIFPESVRIGIWPMERHNPGDISF